MRFKKLDNESWELIFNDEEIKILSTHKKLTFTPLAFRHFGNNLMNLCADMLKKQKDNVNQLETFSGDINCNDKS